jgi:serine phosphatase RsbU (regulator of sigma subunit)/anti-sigma regulatory factor (Ser/Thr protein kinase)
MARESVAPPGPAPYGRRWHVRRVRLIALAEESRTEGDETSAGEGSGDALIGATLQGLRLAAADVEQETRMAEAFQRSLLPDRLPEIPGLASSARYLAGPTDAQIGGDWYDVIELRDGLAGLVIGDVVGSGLEAAAKMARLQNALRAYAADGLRPSVALERMNAFAREAAGGLTATVLYGVVDPERGRMHLASAGHPPPLIISPQGDAWFAEGPAGCPLGAVRFPVYEESTIALEPGATVVLYTDGLIERPGVSLDGGLDWLRGFAADVSGDIDELCSTLLRASFHDASQGDDAALLAVRLASIEPEHLEVTLAAEPESLVYMRRLLGRWLRMAGADHAAAYELLVACGEACANAIAHAYHAGEASSFVVRAHRSERAVELEVRDFGRWRAARPGSEGRGLKLISQLVDKLEIDRGAAGTAVRMSRVVAWDSPEAGR